MLRLNNAAPVAFAGVLADNGAVAAASVLNFTKLGSETLTLTGANTYTGVTNIDDGKVVIGNGGSLGTGAVKITTELEYARTDTFALANQFENVGLGGKLTFVGVGGVAKIVGDTVDTAGLQVEVGAGSTLQIGDNGTTGSLVSLGSLTLGAGSVLRFSRSDTGMPNFSAPISSENPNDGLIVQAGTGRTSILDAAGFTGDIQVDAGELVAADTLALQNVRLITINSAGTFTVGESSLGYGTNGEAPNVILNGGLMRLFEATTASLGAVHDLTLNGGTVSSGTGGTNSLYVVGKIDVTNDATISAQNVGFADSGTGAVATEINVAATKTLTFSGTIADDAQGGFFASSFDKRGAGTLILSGNNSGMTGNNTVTAGVLDVRNANALGNGLTPGQTTTIAGSFVSNQANFVTQAAVAGNITVSNGGSIGVAAPGVAVIGNLSVSNLTLQGGSNIVLKIWDRAGGVGIGYDKLDLGTIDLAGASSVNRVTIRLISMSAANAFGNSTLVKPIDESGFRSFEFGTYNHNPGVNVTDLFRIDASQFTYANGSASDAGLWMVNFDDTNGAITLTAVPEPSTYGFGLGALALAAAAIRRRRQSKKA